MFVDVDEDFLDEKLPSKGFKEKITHARELTKGGECEEALAVYTEVLGLCPDLDEKDSRDAVAIPPVAYAGMAIVYFKQKDYPKAFECYEKCLKIQLEKLGPEHPSVANTYNRMALVYDEQAVHYDAQRDYSQALEYYGKSLGIRLEKVGENDSAIAGTYNSMAMVYSKQEDFLKALKYHEECLKLRLEKLGPDHPDTKETQANIDSITAEIQWNDASAKTKAKHRAGEAALAALEKEEEEADAEEERMERIKNSKEFKEEKEKQQQQQQEAQIPADELAAENIDIDDVIGDFLELEA